MSIGLLGTKIGITREFMKSGQSVPVTVIKIEKGRVLDVITKDKRGYNAVKVGFSKIKNSKLTKQMKGYFTKKNTEAKRKLKEFRVENIEHTISILLENGVQMIDEIPRIGAHGSMIAFVHPKSTGGVLVEIVQRT